MMLTEMELNTLRREAEKSTVKNFALLRALDTIKALRGILLNLTFWERAREPVGMLDEMVPAYDDGDFRQFVMDEIDKAGIE